MWRVLGRHLDKRVGKQLLGRAAMPLAAQSLALRVKEVPDVPVDAQSYLSLGVAHLPQGHGGGLRLCTGVSGEDALVTPGDQ